MKSVFVSSAFKDMQSERDALALKVIPELNIYARDFGESVRFIDLRWGVNTTGLESDDGSRKVLSVCLDEIDKTRPYMIILIGERYGWIPDGDIIKYAAENKSYELEDFKKSVTELEIEYGALARAGQIDKCLFYFREPIDIQHIPLESLGTYFDREDELGEKLASLKEKIMQSGATVKSYSCEWDINTESLVVPESFTEMVRDDVIKLFERDFASKRNLSWQQREELSANTFAEQKVLQFSARNKLLDEIYKKVTSTENRLFVLQGASGSGKSTMMAKLNENLSQRNNTFFFACGNSSHSQTVLDMLKQIVYKLETLIGETKRFGESIPFSKKHANDADVPDDITDESSENTIERWVEKFQEYAFMYATKNTKPLYIICDALDQLMSSQTLTSLKWIPNSLPDKVNILTSVLTEFEIPAFYPLKEKSHIEILHPLSEEEIPEVINGIVASHGKNLDSVVVNKLASMPLASSPLYISMAVQRLVMFDQSDFDDIPVGENFMDIFNNYMMNLIDTFPATLGGMATIVLNEATSRINDEFLQHVLSFLAVARHGLRESDLQGIYKGLIDEYSSIDFVTFTRYLSSFFMLRQDGRIDFTHKILREGILNSTDFLAYNNLILEHLKKLDSLDPIKLSEILWHTYQNDDKDFFVEHISECAKSEDATVLEVTAREVHDIAILHSVWMANIITDILLPSREFSLFLMHDVFHLFDETYAEYACAYDVYNSLYTCLLKALQLFMDTHAFHACACCLRLAEIYMVLGAYDDALQMFIEGKGLRMIEIADKYYNKPATHVKLAQAYTAIGDIYDIKGETDVRQSYYALAHEIWEQLSLEKPNALYTFRAINYDHMGDNYSANEDYDKALEMYNKSFEIRKALLKKDSSNFNRSNLAVSYSKLGTVYAATGEEAEMIEMFNENFKIRKAVADNTQSVEDYNNLAASFYHIGALYRFKLNFTEAINMFDEAIAIQTIVKDKVNTTDSRRSLGISYYVKAEAYFFKPDMKEALINANKSYDFLSKLNEEQNSVDTKKHLAKLHVLLGSFYFKNNENDKALKNYFSAFNLQTEILSSNNLSEISNAARLTCALIRGVYKELGNIEEANAWGERFAQYGE